MASRGPSELQLAVKDVMDLDGMTHYLIINEDGWYWIIISGSRTHGIYIPVHDRWHRLLGIPLKWSGWTVNADVRVAVFIRPCDSKFETLCNSSS